VHLFVATLGFSRRMLVRPSLRERLRRDDLDATSATIKVRKRRWSRIEGRA
jgi:hypothetical protein